MLRQPRSRYEVGRSLTLLKVKSFRDAEARVLEHLKGAGRHKGRLGAAARGAGRRDAVLGRDRLLRRRTRGAPADRLRHHVPLPGAFRRRRAAVPVLRRRPGRCRLARTRRRPRPRQSPKVPAPAPTSSASQAARRFELVEGSSSKFWEVARDGCAVTVRYGRIGSDGQAKTKEFASEELARRHADGLIEEKVAKGYREHGDS